MSDSLGFLLESDRARSIFVVLFTFYRDEACEDDAMHNFQNALCDILLGASLPLGATAKLQIVFESVMAGREDFHQALEQVDRDFSEQREVLFFVARIILRISQDSGMFCRRDKERIRDVLMTFQFSAVEMDRFTNEECRMLDYVLEGAAVESSELYKHYRVLGCEPGATDAQIRQTYRTLAKMYHPDRTAALEMSSDGEPELRARFEEVQVAYEAIRKSRDRL